MGKTVCTRHVTLPPYRTIFSNFLLILCDFIDLNVVLGGGRTGGIFGRDRQLRC